MAYKTNPIANRLGLSVGWQTAYNPTTQGKYATKIQKLILWYFLFKEYLSIKSMRLFYFRLKNYYIQKNVTKNRSNKKYSPLSKDLRPTIELGVYSMLKRSELEYNIFLNDLLVDEINSRQAYLMAQSIFKKKKIRTKENIMSREKRFSKILQRKFFNISKWASFQAQKRYYLRKLKKEIRGMKKKVFRRHPSFLKFYNKIRSFNSKQKKYSYLRQLFKKKKLFTFFNTFDFWKSLLYKKKLKKLKFIIKNNYYKKLQFLYKTKIKLYPQRTLISSLNYRGLLGLICLKKKLNLFLKTHNILNWTINLKWPVHNSPREYFEMFNYSFYKHLVKKFQKQKHYKNTLRIFYLLSEYKDVKILSEHFAYELLRDKKRHKRILHSINAMLKIKEFFPKGIFKTLRIGVHGKINAKLRTQHYYMQNGPKPKNQDYSRQIHYHLAYSHAKTGVFGIHIWAQISEKIKEEKNITFKHR